MNDYFKPLRRQIGVVTLVMACVFAAGWLRSGFVRDQIFIRTGSCVYTFESVDSTLIWVRTYHWDHNNWDDLSVWKVGKMLPTKQIISEAYELPYTQLRFGFGAFENANRDVHYWIIPYWSVPLPLTLLSAWLLLSKVRVKTV